MPLACALVIGLTSAARAEPWLAPGDVALRSDLYTLSDAGILTSPLTSWPLSWGDIVTEIGSAETPEDPATLAALEAIRTRAEIETRVDDWYVHAAAAVADHPRFIRTFEDSPREDAELGAALVWTGQRFAARLSATRAWNASDGESVRLDGTYLGVAIGNWMVSVGYPERWWGPGMEGSLILSTNARPMPQISINRNQSEPFAQRWLRWVGPWSATTFMARMDDERVVADTLLFGIRVAAKPLPRVEIGFSRTAQWCGKDRPCDAQAFANLLVGRDNSGVNVGTSTEPGNQLGGMDVRWALPFERAPDALYMQWIGEDSRQGGPQIGSWLRQIGLEFAGEAFGDWRQRSYLEVADTICREGGIGAGKEKFGCAYEHHIYQTGYRYRGRSVGHAIDGDGTIYSAGTTLLAADGRSWLLSARRIKVNQSGTPTNTVSPTPQRIAELAVSHERRLRLGSLRAGAGYQRIRDPSGAAAADHSAFAWIEFVVN